MSGYNLLLKIRRLEQQCEELGFMFSQSKHSYRDYGDVVALKPKDSSSLPIYSRDAELFCGTFEELEIWLRGLEWARNYDSMVFGKTHDRKRQRKEQDWRNIQLVGILAADGAVDK